MPRRTTRICIVPHLPGKHYCATSAETEVLPLGGASIQEALSMQKAEDLEVSLFRDMSRTSEVSKITGNLIALLQGIHVAQVFRSDMTLLEFVEVFTLVDSKQNHDRKCEYHPDALMRIALGSDFRADASVMNICSTVSHVFNKARL